MILRTFAHACLLSLAVAPAAFADDQVSESGVNDFREHSWLAAPTNLSVFATPSNQGRNFVEFHINWSPSSGAARYWVVIAPGFNNPGVCHDDLNRPNGAPTGDTTYERDGMDADRPFTIVVCAQDNNENFSDRAITNFRATDGGGSREGRFYYTGGVGAGIDSMYVNGIGAPSMWVDISFNGGNTQRAYYTCDQRSPNRCTTRDLDNDIIFTSNTSLWITDRACDLHDCRQGFFSM